MLVIHFQNHEPTLDSQNVADLTLFEFLGYGFESGSQLAFREKAEISAGRRSVGFRILFGNLPEIITFLQGRQSLFGLLPLCLNLVRTSILGQDDNFTNVYTGRSIELLNMSVIVLVRLFSR